MLTKVSGFKVGHFTDNVALTGCTVILCPPKTKGSCEVRGNSPGSRELALLAPEKSMQEVHAVLLTGGSAFGLGAAEGVMKWLSEHDIGYVTPWIKVPIVPTAVIFDLNVGSSTTWPDAIGGYSACENAVEGNYENGSVGAGTGARIGKWSGLEYAMNGGVGSAFKAHGELVVSVLAVVNAVGDIIGEDGKIVAGAQKNGRFLWDENQIRVFSRGKVLDSTNTTLVVAATNANLTKLELFKICQRMHDGMARAIVPVHTSYDGDVTFALSAGSAVADFDLVAEMAAALTAEAIRNAVTVSSSRE